MAALAMSLLAVRMIRPTHLVVVLPLPAWRSTTNVHGRGDRLEVVRVNTASVAAEMVQLQAVGDRSDESFPNQPMRLVPSAGAVAVPV